jgi:glycosyltransferase involved in cell wall biosynthesis
VPDEHSAPGKMTLRVAFDATAIPAQRVGAGVYVAELLCALDRLDADMHVFVNARDSAEFATSIPNATLHAVRLPNRAARIAWAHYVLPLALRRLRPDVVHGPHYTLPRVSTAGVVTFHDPTFFTMPELHERSKVVYFTRAARKGIDRAARVIAVSEYARRGAVEHGGADPARVDVVFNGVDPARYSPPATDETVDPYILFVGALEPRKDVPNLIAAFAALARNGFAHRLVLAGPPAWGADRVDAAIHRLGVAVDRLSYVPEDRKIDLYRHASLFVYPTIAEGFGLPVLEAMACGAPVVTTTGSAPEEIAGDAALLVPPRDAYALREAMARVLGDPELAASLRRQGPERARQFTWERTAAGTLDAYRKAIA